MNFWKRLLRGLESLLLWHSYFSWIPFPVTEMQRRWLRPIIKRRLTKEAEWLRECEVRAEFARSAYDHKFRGSGTSSPRPLAAEIRLWEKAHSREMKAGEIYQKLEALWMFLREIRVLSPEWGENVEEFLQSTPREPFRRKLLEDLSYFFPTHDHTALSR